MFSVFVVLLRVLLLGGTERLDSLSERVVGAAGLLVVPVVSVGVLSRLSRGTLVIRQVQRHLTPVFRRVPVELLGRTVLLFRDPAEDFLDLGLFPGVGLETGGEELLVLGGGEGDSPELFAEDGDDLEVSLDDSLAVGPISIPVGVGLGGVVAHVIFLF